MATLTPQELERALLAALPPAQADRAPDLARLITEAASTGQVPPANPRLAPALQALAGRELRAGDALINFGSSQLGDVTIGDLAGGDIVRISLNLAPTNVAVGRNIVQIGTLVLPLRLILVLLALLALGALALAFALRGPRSMADTGTFRIAVAEFARDEGGRLRSDPEASRLSRQVFDTLRQQQALYVAQNPAEVIGIWHDSLGWREKGATIGIVQGITAAEREQFARRRLGELAADALIYGYLDSDGRVALNFYVSPALKTESGPGVLAGAYQLGEPQRPAGLNLTTRAGALFWLLKGLQYDSAGQAERSLAVLQRGEELLPDWSELGEGKEILRYFQGQAALFSALRAPDQAAFDEQLAYGEERFRQALAARSDFLRPAIGLGSVAYLRSSCALGVRPCAPLPSTSPERDQALRTAQTFIEIALARYEEALALAPNSADAVWAETVAPSAVGSAHVLRGEIALQAGDRTAADAAYALAVDHIRPSLDAAAADQRILAQGSMFLGTALWRRGMLAESTPAIALPLFAEARAAFATCLAQASAADALLERELFPACRSGDEAVAAAIARLEELHP